MGISRQNKEIHVKFNNDLQIIVVKGYNIKQLQMCFLKTAHPNDVFLFLAMVKPGMMDDWL